MFVLQMRLLTKLNLFSQGQGAPRYSTRSEVSPPAPRCTVRCCVSSTEMTLRFVGRRRGAACLLASLDSPGLLGEPLSLTGHFPCEESPLTPERAGPWGACSIVGDCIACKVSTLYTPFLLGLHVDFISTLRG